MISAPFISKTIFGSNHTSASSSDFTLECLWVIWCLLSVFGSFSRSSSVKPEPHLQTVLKMSSSGSYAARSSAPYVPALLPLPWKR